MIKNYLKTTFRSFSRNRLNSFINVVGLTMGIACAIVLFLLADYASSYNRFEKNYDRIYRFVNSSPGQGGEIEYTPGVPLPFVAAVKEDFSNFEQVMLVKDYYGETLFTIDPDSQSPTFYELQDKRIAFVDNDYLKTFTITWLEGNKDEALQRPGGVVLSKSLADQMFPEGNVLGQPLVFNKQYDLYVEGVMADLPKNSDMPFDAFFALSTINKEIEEGEWNSVSSADQCYVLLKAGDNPENYSDRIAEFTAKHFDEEDKEVYELQPMSDFHFNENYGNLSYSSTSKNEILAMVLIGIFLILTACVNFINLSTAIAIKRSKEVGVRKVLGGTRKQLAFQFLSESFGIILLSMICGLGLAELLIIYINPFLDTQLDIDLFNVQFLAFLFLGLVVITLLAAFYPAILLSGFKPTVALKSMITSRNSGRMSLRQGLVVFQFFISQLFIIGTIIILVQLDFVKNADLGFDTEAIINVRIPEEDKSKKTTLTTEVSRLAGVKDISLSFSPPSSGSISVSNFKLEENGEDFYTAMKYADEHYLDVFGMQLLAGRTLSPSDTLKEIIVNEKLLRYMGHQGSYDDAIGKQVRIWGLWVPIVGVVKDFHSASLRNEIMTSAIFSYSESYRLASIKVNLGAFEDTNEEIRKIWKSLYPEYDYDYTFYDDQLAESYEGERKMASVFGFFSIVAIIVGCLGLFGLSSFMINQKTKEIGIRKTLGASVRSIVGMFSWAFVKLILLAFVLAVPLSWYTMNEWLHNFKFRIDLSPVLFASGLLATMIVAIITVGYKSVSAATANPVDSLRDE